MISRRSKEGGDESMWGRIRRRRRSTTRRSATIGQALGALGNVRGRFAESTKPPPRAYANAVGLRIGALLLFIMTLLLFRLLRRRARETDLATPEPEEGVEAARPEEEIVSPAPPSAEEVSLMEQPPPGEERPERRGVTPTSPPSPREAPPPGEERPGRR